MIHRKNMMIPSFEERKRELQKRLREKYGKEGKK